jgi:DNA gyrase/topoisomerase IV subunit B
MIFSNLKAGSNFDDTEERTVVGTNGVGSVIDFRTNGVIYN